MKLFELMKLRQEVYNKKYFYFLKKSRDYFMVIFAFTSMTIHASNTSNLGELYPLQAHAVSITDSLQKNDFIMIRTNNDKY